MSTNPWVPPDYLVDAVYGLLRDPHLHSVSEKDLDNVQFDAGFTSLLGLQNPVRLVVEERIRTALIKAIPTGVAAVDHLRDLWYLPIPGEFLNKLRTRDWEGPYMLKLEPQDPTSNPSSPGNNLILSIKDGPIIP